MIYKMSKVFLNDKEFDSFSFLASINQNMCDYICDVNEAKSYFKEFLNKADLQEINENNVKYVMFTKQM